MANGRRRGEQDRYGTGREIWCSFKVDLPAVTEFVLFSCSRAPRSSFLPFMGTVLLFHARISTLGSTSSCNRQTRGVECIAVRTVFHAQNNMSPSFERREKKIFLFFNPASSALQTWWPPYSKLKAVCVASVQKI